MEEILELQASNQPFADTDVLENRDWDMIHIKYKIDKSAIHGVGFFTLQDLKKGDLIFTASPGLDVNITQEQFDALNESEQREVRYWGFFDQPTKKWHVD